MTIFTIRQMLTVCADPAIEWPELLFVDLEMSTVGLTDEVILKFLKKIARKERKITDTYVMKKSGRVRRVGPRPIIVPLFVPCKCKEKCITLVCEKGPRVVKGKSLASKEIKPTIL